MHWKMVDRCPNEMLWSEPKEGDQEQGREDGDAAERQCS